jgi:RHS repeat-associated protein
LITFAYDWKGRRIQKQVQAGTSVTNNTTFVYDSWNPIARLNATNSNLLQYYVWGLDLSGTMQGAGLPSQSEATAGGVGGLLEMNDAVNGVCFAGYDGNGNVAALVSAANGAVSALYEYGPFGEVIRKTGTMGTPNPFRFSTKFQDDETDLVYYGYRYYNTTLGRWLGRDPKTEGGALNLYSFVGNKPVAAIDFLGLAVPACDSVDANPQLAAECYNAIDGVTGTMPAPRPVPVPLPVPISLWDKVCGCTYCFIRHPTWVACRPDATKCPSAAVLRDAPTVPGWSGPYVNSVKEDPTGAKSCPGGAPGRRFYVNINYIRQLPTGSFQRYPMTLSGSSAKCVPETPRIGLADL